MSEVVSLPDSMITIDEFLEVWRAHAGRRKQCVLLLDCCWSSHWLKRWRAEEWPRITVCRSPMSQKDVLERYVTTSLAQESVKESSFSGCADLMRAMRAR